MHDYIWIVFLFVAMMGNAVPIVATYFITRSVLNRKKDKWFEEQVNLWEENKIISTEQKIPILNFSRINRAAPKKKIDMVKIISLFGAVFIGIGLIFLVASNWQEIPKYVRTTALLIMTIGTLWAGYFLSYEKGKYPVLGKSLIVLSTILWGATLALIAQIYNLSSDGSWVILILWALPLLPLAYFLENEYIFILATVILGIWDISYSVGKSLPNYYYPALAFVVLLPLAKKFQKGLVLNIIALIIGAYYAAILKYPHVALMICFGFAIYYVAKIIKVVRFPELFLFCSSIALLACNIGYSAVSDFKTANYFLLMLLIPLFFLAYQDKAKATIGINILNFIVWVNLVIAAVINTYKPDVGVIATGTFEIFLGVLFYLSGVLHQNLKEDKDYGKIYKIFGFFLVFGVIYFLSFKEIMGSGKSADNFVSVISYCLAVLGLITLIYTFSKGYLKTKEAKLEALAILIAISGAVIMLVNPSEIKLNLFIANAVLVMISTLMLFIGMEIQSPKIFNSGIAALVLFIATRYLDVFWKLQEKSLFFIISGILFIGGGSFLEKKRKEIVRRMKDEK